MTWTNLPPQLIKLLAIISCTSLSFLAVEGQSAELEILHRRVSLSKQLLLTQSSPPQPGQGTPSGTPPATGRNPCSESQKPLTALVPMTKQPNDLELRSGKTTKAHPTFWFYVPYESKSIESVKFSLRDTALPSVMRYTKFKI